MALDNHRTLLDESFASKDPAENRIHPALDPETEHVVEEMFRRLLRPNFAATTPAEITNGVTEAATEPAQTEVSALDTIQALAVTEPETALAEIVPEIAPQVEAEAALETASEAEVETAEPKLRRGESLKWLGIVLLAALPVLAIAGALRLWNFGQPSAYMDEASYIVTGRMLVEDGKVYANALQWTFGSFLYPVLAGLLDAQGGLIAARSLSLIFGLVTVLATIFLTLGLFKAVPKSQAQARADYALGSKPVSAALLAGLLVAVLPTTIALSQFATYDAMAAGLFASGCAAFVWGRRQVEVAEQSGTKRTALILALFALAALCLFGAFLTKYVVALYFPALCLLLLAVKAERRYGFLSFVAPLSAACLAYYLLFSTDLAALLHFGGQYQALRSSDWLQEYVWNRPELLLLAVVGYWGLRQTFRDGRISQALLLVGGAFLLLLFQLITRADYDYWKHSVYLIIMLAPLAGWLWSDWSWWDEPSSGPGWIRRRWDNFKARRVTTPEKAASLNRFEQVVAGDNATERPGSYSLMATLVVGLVVLGVFWSQTQAQNLLSHWPSLTPALAQIQTASKEASTVLVDDSALVYYLYGRVPAEKITTPFFNNYKGLRGAAAYQQAVKDQQYSLVILDGGVTGEGKEIWQKVRPVIVDSPAYELEFSQPLESANLSEKHSLEIYRLLSPEEQQDPNRPKKQPPVASPPAPVAPATPAATVASTATPAAKPAQTAKATATPAATAAPTATAVPTATAKPTQPAPVYPAKAAYDFANGDEGWGALPQSGGLQPGMAVSADDAYPLVGHPSLRFTPQPANKLYTVGVNYTGKVRKISLFVYIPADKADSPVWLGFYYFDQKWGWNDDGFQTKVTPGQWTQLIWELPAEQSIQQFGLKLVGFSGSVYINGVTVE